MTHDDVAHRLAEDPGLRLLRSENAPLVLGFLYAQFKRQPRVMVAQAQLVERLEDDLLALRTRHPDRYSSPAQVYLNQWCDEQHQYLRRYFESGSDDPAYELTPATERVIGWIEDLNKNEFVGTESRFLQIFDLLEEIVRKSTEDPQIRLAQLEAQKAALEAEISEIRKTGRVERYNETQIKERFLKANDETRRLLADFREVEANFREVTRQMQERRLREAATKGDLVGYVIDADEALKESDQGRSFYAFWRFLISHAKKQELRSLLEQVYALPEVQELKSEYGLLRGLVRHLSEAGEKIVQSNRRLAEQLRRMLDEAHLREHQRVQELIDAIKVAVLAIREDPPAERAFILLDGFPDIDLPMERPLWRPEDPPRFACSPSEPDPASLGMLDLTGLFDPFAVEREELERRIRDVLLHRPQATLAEIVKRYPIEKGLSELLVYLSIATDAGRHVVDETHTDRIPIRSRNQPPHGVTMPRVIFVR